MSSSQVTNVVIAGLGGQGVLKASDILADVAFAAGLDVKKSEVHGMSQRGGSVASDVRFGEHVYSPMVPEGEADYLVVVSSDQVPVNEHVLRSGGTLLEPAQFDLEKLRSKEECQRHIAGSVEPTPRLFRGGLGRRNSPQSARGLSGSELGRLQTRESAKSRLAGIRRQSCSAISSDCWSAGNSGRGRTT
jgi:indolepyruvate ferredoxin oxidoreductase, beta subunit